jgi:hypothetical protein
VDNGRQTGPLAVLARRQRATFAAAVTVLAVAITGLFFYELRAQEIERIGLQEQHACETRNVNTEAIRDALQSVATSTDTYTRGQIQRAVLRLKMTDCDRFLN